MLEQVLSRRDLKISFQVNISCSWFTKLYQYDKKENSTRYDISSDIPNYDKPLDSGNLFILVFVSSYFPNTHTEGFLTDI